MTVLSRRMINTTTKMMMMKLRMMIITTVFSCHTWSVGRGSVAPHQMCLTQCYALAHQLPPKHINLHTGLPLAQYRGYSCTFHTVTLVLRCLLQLHIKRRSVISTAQPPAAEHIRCSAEVSTFAWENVPPPSYLSHGGSWGLRGGLRTLSSSA